MNIGIVAIPVVALASVFAAPAQAQSIDKSDLAHAAILSGDYVAAERQLTVDQDSPEAMLNLAVVMMQTGRPGAARQLYQHVLATDDAQLTLASGRSASAHDIARRGLDRLEDMRPRRYASR